MYFSHGLCTLCQFREPFYWHPHTTVLGNVASLCHLLPRTAMLENRKKVSFDSSLHAKVSLFSFSIHCATTSFYHLVTSLDKNSRVLALRQKSELRSGRAPAEFSELRSGSRSGWQSGVALRPALRPLRSCAPTALRQKFKNVSCSLKMVQNSSKWLKN